MTQGTKAVFMWIQGALGYMLMIAYIALRSPNNEELILSLTDHLFPFLTYGLGFAVMGYLFDLSKWILTKVMHSSSSKETPE